MKDSSYKENKYKWSQPPRDPGMYLLVESLPLYFWVT